MGAPDQASSAGSKPAAFERVLVHKGTDTAGTQVGGAGSGDMRFEASTPGNFSVGDYISGTNIRKNTRVTFISSDTIFVSRPLTGVVSGTITILSSRHTADDGPPGFELKAGTDISIAAASQNAVGATVLEISATGSTLDIDGLTAIGSLANADTFPVDDGDGGTNRKATMTQLKTYLTSSGYVSITGTDHRMVRMNDTTGIQDTGITVDDSDNITGVTSLTAGDLTTTDDITVGDDLILSDGSKIVPVAKTGTDAAGNNLNLYAGTGTGAGSSRIDFFTKSANGSGSTDSFSLSNRIVMKDGKLGIGAGVASDVNGNRITHNLTITDDTSAEFVAMALSNRDDTNNTNGSVSMLFNLEDTGGNTVDSGKIKVVKNEAFTATSTTQDSNMEFYTSLNGTLGKKFEILSTGTKVTGDLEVTGDLNITGDINTVTVTELDVVDKVINLAKGAADSNAANGAGFFIDGASASMLYSDTGTKFTINKPLDITGALNVTGTITGDTSLTLDAVTISTAEIGVLDGVTPGTVAASKAVVVDSSKDIGNFNSISTEHAKMRSVSTAGQSFDCQAGGGAAKDLYSYAFASFRTVKLFGHIVDDSSHETDAFEVLVTYDGASGPSATGDVHMTTYAYISSNDTPMGTLAAVKDGTNIKLQFTNTVTDFTGSFVVTATQLVLT
mgnify:FL=1